MSGFNLSALAVRERAVTLFLIVAISLAGVFESFDGGESRNICLNVRLRLSRCPKSWLRSGCFGKYERTASIGTT